MLSPFPPITRARLFNQGRIVIGEARRSVESKGDTTKKSRMDCFIKYCHKVDLREPTAEKYQQKTKYAKIHQQYPPLGHQPTNMYHQYNSSLYAIFICLGVHKGEKYLFGIVSGKYSFLLV